MAFCKVCPCGEKIVFEKIFLAPDECPFCGRRLLSLPAFKEDSEEVERNLKKYNSSDEDIDNDDNKDFEDSQTDRTDSILYLISNDGERIDIPPEGGIIGRDRKSVV